MENGSSSEDQALAARMPEKLLFQGLTPEQCRKVAEIVTVVRCERGHVVVPERDYGDSLYVLDQGAVEVRVASPEGDRLVCELTAPKQGEVCFSGDFFGEMCLLDLEPRCASVIALEDCVLWEINRDRLYWLFGDDKDLQLRILLSVARVLSRRLNLMDQAAAQRQDV
ncbi:MAG: cyclic nucleotide-binding domain-containing protein [Planctomycetes bacterium]|nr:cyclic nucleotide-binding domain-containing protein [Planctomycetota bacterium]